VNSSRIRPRSVRSACEYRPDIAATNSSRTAMLIRLILDPADEHRSGANQMRQWLSFQEHSRRGNAEARVKLDEKVLPDARRQEGVSPTDIAHPANGAALKGARWLAVAADRVGRG